MFRQKSTASFKDLLDRYRTHLRAPQGSVIKEVAAAYRTLNVPCEELHLAYTPTTRLITIRAMGPLKTEMLLRKSAVLTALQSSLSSRDIPLDII